MSKGKRGNHLGPRPHQFIGEAEPERAQARAQKDERVQKDHEKLEQELVTEMAHELEKVAGVPVTVATSAPAAAQASAPAAAQASAPAAAQASAAAEEAGVLPLRPESFKAGVELLREKAPAVLDEMREKAESRLNELPRPLQNAASLAGTAAGKTMQLAFAPLRLGLRVAGAVVRAPLAVARLLLRRRTTA